MLAHEHGGCGFRYSTKTYRALSDVGYGGPGVGREKSPALTIGAKDEISVGEVERIVDSSVGSSRRYHNSKTETARVCSLPGHPDISAVLKNCNEPTPAERELKNALRKAGKLLPNDTL